MPFLFIILGVNATLAITRIFIGDTFHMDDIIIANVIGSLFAFMVYNVQRAQVLDKRLRRAAYPTGKDQE